MQEGIGFELVLLKEQEMGDGAAFHGSLTRSGQVRSGCNAPRCGIQLNIFIRQRLMLEAHDIVMEEFMVPAAAAGISLYVRNKRPRDCAWHLQVGKRHAFYFAMAVFAVAVVL